ncbi:hypothetical protein PT974_09186 [Cladobotryum mycophilum]|uniref:Uncharacterized protein n=1 Tax=Cladobotryum mycophilum TaxID=491253 RepID=A0ABR0SFK7_9HYPO
MGSSESKQAGSRLQGANLSHVKFPQAVYLKYKNALSFQLHLCDEHSNPFYLITLPDGWYGKLVVYGGLSKDDLPLATVDQSSALSRHSTVTLAPASQGQQPIEEQLRMHSNGPLSVAYTFVIAVEGSPLPEKFEWRGSKNDDVKSLGERSWGWKLVRMGHDDEVVAVWADVAITKSLHKTAKFEFKGSGASGELGDVWKAMAVATFLRLWQLNSQGGVAASNSASAAVAAGV